VFSLSGLMVKSQLIGPAKRAAVPPAGNGGRFALT